MPITVAAVEPAPDDPPPYEYIAAKLLQGEIIPFLGAGASVLDRSAHCPPTGSALAQRLAQLSAFPKDGDLRPDLSLVASYLALVSIDPHYLYEVLNEVFKPLFPPNDLHQLLAEVARNHQKLLIITTNYDDMIERAFDANDAPYHLVVTSIGDVESGGTLKYKEPGRQGENFKDVEPDALDISLENASIIYKMHGSIVRHATDATYYVITEEDYIRFLGRMSIIIPDRIISLLTFRANSIKPFLFLGYSLSDWNFRVMLDMLWDVGKGRQRRRSFAIQRQPKKVERKIWETKRVSIFDLDLQQFTDQLRQEVHRLEPSL